MKIKIGLVNHHQLFLNAFSAMLESLLDFEVVVNVRNGRLLQGDLEDQKYLPDLMLIDTDMPVMDGVETTLWLQQHYPSIKLIALGKDEKDRSIIKMLKAGCCAYLYMVPHLEELKHALQQVYTKGYFNPDATQSIWPGFIGGFNRKEIITLTHEEQRFLQLAYGELGYHEIVHEMNISQKVANGYIKSLFKKFRVKSRPGLILEALRSERMEISV